MRVLYWSYPLCFLLVLFFQSWENGLCKLQKRSQTNVAASWGFVKICIFSESNLDLNVCLFVFLCAAERLIRLLQRVGTERWSLIFHVSSYCVWEVWGGGFKYGIFLRCNSDAKKKKCRTCKCASMYSVSNIHFYFTLNGRVVWRWRCVFFFS